MGTTALVGNAPVQAASSDPVTRMPAMRQGPDDTREDSARLVYMKELWNSQTGLFLTRDRMIEENVRMLAGDQWSVFHQGTGQFVDISEFLRDDEKRWRQRPVVNYLLRWFMLTHARMTESSPIVNWNPGPDASDADLAEALTLAQKCVWRDANMDDVHFRMMAWLIAAGSVYTLSRIDPDGGQWTTETADVPLPILGPDGSVLGMTPQPIPNVPLTEQYQPAVGMSPDGQMIPLPGKQPWVRRQGRIAVDVLTPLEVRGEWSQRAWYDKSWHALDCLYTPDELESQWGVKIDPQRRPSLDDRRARVLYGTGAFGAMSARGGGATSQQAMRDLIPVRQFWFRPRASDPRMRETPNEPGGRYVVMTDDRIIFDGPRPVAYPFTSPIHRWDFVYLPGRASGTTPQEALNGPQRSSNKARAIVMENANLVGSPKFVVDEASGIDLTKWTNEPGTGVSGTLRNGIDPVRWLNPPAVGESVYSTLSQTRDDINVIGNLDGASGKSPTTSASGELVKELRFNEDRYYGPTLRRAVPEFGRMFQTWRAMMPLIYDRETILSITGEDRVVKTITVYPEMFETGTVNAEPDLESMLPEGRGERRQRVQWMYEGGMFGPPGSPEAIAQYMERARFPHDSRTMVPAHVDWQTAERENGELALGADPMSIPIYEWYDHAVHIAALERVMKGQDFKKFPPNVQQGFMMHRQAHLSILQQQQARMMRANAPAPNAPPGAPSHSNGNPNA